MAVVKKKTEERVQRTSLIKKKKNLDEELNIELPTEYSEPATSIGDYTFLLYGSKKIGKTSLASQFPKALAFMFEPGGKALRLLQLACPTWPHFKQALDKLTGKHMYRTCIIDTVSVAYERCMEYACQKASIDHPSDEGYGKGWDRVKKEFTSQLSQLMLSDTGLLMLAHDKIAEIETRSGRKFNKTMPNLTGQAEGFVSATIDVIGYYHIVDNQRWLQIREDDYAVAGCRCEENFLALDGQPVFKIPMGTSAQEAYANLITAFNNKQKESYTPEAMRRRLASKKVVTRSVTETKIKSKIGKRVR